MVLKYIMYCSKNSGLLGQLYLALAVQTSHTFLINSLFLNLLDCL